MQAPPDRSAVRTVSRRFAVRAGSIGLAGLRTADVVRWQCRAENSGNPSLSRKAVIYLFLTGGPSQHDTFDMKPDGPSEFRGEFSPIATAIPGIQVCEHLPMLAQRSHLWSLVRSLSHKENGHDKGTFVMLTGNSVVPPTFRSSLPQSSDLPSIAAIAGSSTRRTGILPASAVLPEKIYHSNTGVYPGQFAGMLGASHEPWMIECTDKPHAYHSYSGAFPTYLFDLHKGQLSDKRDWRFEVPHLTLAEGVLKSQFDRRVSLLQSIDRQREHLQGVARVSNYDQTQKNVVSLLRDPTVRAAFDVRHADPRTLERYGDNSFGWSLLMARRLVEAGVNLVQVNMGNFGSWDLHGNNFPLLKDYLFPPTDRAVSALLDDLQDSGLLETTLIVMAGEFGRTPRIYNVAPDVYRLPGRDHWAPCQSVLLAGGGVVGGQVIGASDRNGAYPVSELQTPENLAATIYQALDIPRDAVWHDNTGRPHQVYQADPIERLTA